MNYLKDQRRQRYQRGGGSLITLGIVLGLAFFTNGLILFVLGKLYGYQR